MHENGPPARLKTGADEQRAEQPLGRAEFFALPVGALTALRGHPPQFSGFFRNILLQFRPENLYTGESKVF
jgi:hypothetical protein